MKLKAALSSVVLSLFAIVFFVQAQTASAGNPPDSFPVSSSISGHIYYKTLGNFVQMLNHLFVGPTVTVKATNIFNSSQTFTTTAMPNGNYMLDVPNGHYFLEVSDTNHTFFVPVLRSEIIHNNTKTNQNFQGLVFSF